MSDKALYVMAGYDDKTEYYLNCTYVDFGRNLYCAEK